METVQAKKSLGQNFLRDVDIIDGILEIADLGSEDRVLEIGPGTGALTSHLLAHVASVTAVEIDHDMIVRLGETFCESKGLSLLEANILDMDLGTYLRDAGFEDGKYKIIANIPYYITAPIIRLLLSLAIRPERMVLMVQEEVADRLTAPPGGMSLLSLSAQYYADVTKELFVPKTAFDPVPKVDSAVISLVPKREFSAESDRKLFRIARAGFAARRKTLANNLSSSLRIPRKEIESMLGSLGLSTLVRAQELAVDEWIRFSERIDRWERQPER
ncbi:MAG TPA: 16S rRNA (adenine(1518)-N(6)/adenine(1519)-N(6))-dimethyltransferase RsmA [Candidatus Fimivivens sp.]|nr:16S rRNA (adenine(1518)-N(6)/adenine(1519)-N(6))-dimethyltransferase RsmA [Candidatus Fimivivens sp.]